MQCIQLFPVDIFIEDTTNLTVDNEKLSEEILKREKSKEGRDISNVGGWQSQPLLTNETWDEFDNLLDFVKKSFEKVCVHSRYQKKIKFGIASPWLSVNRHRDYNQVHQHGQMDWSWVYYAKSPKKCGDIVFIDPRIRKTMRPQDHLMTKEHEANHMPNPALCTQYKMPVLDGRLVIFPAYVEHYVEPNLSQEPRISIAGNIFLQAAEMFVVKNVQLEKEKLDKDYTPISEDSYRDKVKGNSKGERANV
tara:strand:+ start:307 stop:1053 length:747 start_codon:yes stop_codon:yes gene_type:complete